MRQSGNFPDNAWKKGGIMKYVINEGQRALVFKEGKLVDYLKEGTYNNFGFFNKIFDVHECEGQLKSEKKLDIL